MKDVNQHFGYISPRNVETLQKYVKLLAEDRDEVVIADIGTCAGKSAITMAIASPKATVYTCDPIYTFDVNSNFHYYGVGQQVIFFPVPSMEFAQKYCPEQLDMVFVDGQHGYSPGARNDLEYVGVRVKQGGYILVHDRNLYPGIEQAVREFENKMYEFVEEDEKYPDEARQGTIYVGRRL